MTPADVQTNPSRVVAFARDIKLSHTIFAMPWALLATLLAWRAAPGMLLAKLSLIVGCMVVARTAAMSANRLLDADMDALNPRTAGRAIPAGRLARRFYRTVLALCSLLLLLFASGFWLLFRNPWPALLALPVLAFICSYPLGKRFTSLCHFHLGAALGLAPICAYVAVAAALDWTPVIMAGAVMFWTAGFDIIYATQDYHSDLQTGVVSLPARLGIGPALWVSRLTHACAAGLFLLVGVSSSHLGTVYYVGATAAILLLIVEHAIVRADDLSKVGIAFFTLNGLVSLLAGSLGALDVLLHHGRSLP